MTTEVKGKLTKVNGIPTLIVKTKPVPGRDGKDGRDGTSVSKDEVINSLKEDNDFLRSIIDKRQWDFAIERDDKGNLINVRAISKFEGE